MHHVLITGVTGFVGRALAANFLTHGAKVTAVSRNDPDGIRTTEAVLNAARGCELDVSGAVEHNLRILNIDFANLESELAAAGLGEITEIWHVAAEMSYSSHKLGVSFDTNVGNSARLYETALRHAPHCRRFYYVSTAFVADMAGGPVREELHAKTRIVNAYQVTKWSTEQSLHLLHLRCGLPVTIFRPTVVVGHRRTGWAHQNGFGFYMFQDAMIAIAAAGHKEIAVDLVAEIRPDLVPIDRLCADAKALTLREDSGDEFEVFHASGGLNVPMGELVRIWGRAAGVNARIGPPSNLLEEKFDRGIGLNRPFGRTEWQFERSQLDTAIGLAQPVQPLTSKEVETLCAWYVGVSSGANTPRTAELAEASQAIASEV
ncbi:NAD-dependent epimerase/dehydratase family protein [Microbulbifer thermotolerans]|uniref:NAD-dependent epimerase/dehydratase family protein n=1 Tax=Microbulbifer thermotolerans TaxID=252514 RepID=UPI002248FB04|nr:SDR family oxidoreductase [Microbulbifer thermotolerans]MCX2832111.1 SDR family oxidoreductase [Microbulbifer thermotolerans]